MGAENRLPVSGTGKCAPGIHETPVVAPTRQFAYSAIAVLRRDPLFSCADLYFGARAGRRLRVIPR